MNDLIGLPTFFKSDSLSENPAFIKMLTSAVYVLIIELLSIYGLMIMPAMLISCIRKEPHIKVMAVMMI